MDFAKLTRYDATFRSDSLRIDSYELELDLGEATTSPTFPVEVGVKLTSKSEQIFLDYLGESVESVTINGNPVPWEQKGGRIVLDVPAGLVGRPIALHVRAHSWYSRSGQGLHRFTDPQDGNTYLYSHSEPSDARRIFPCFDQPDLKAQCTVRMTVPQGWVALSNQPETTREAGTHGDTVTFRATPPLSTYLMAFAAGPYVAQRDTWCSPDGKREIELGVWSRASMAEHVDSEILEVTKQGLDFFDKNFDFPYPWTKYDSIFVPEYNLGAMENPGLVTFTEAYIFRSPATDAQHAHRANTILHEMSHMWFGDLVTPLWWDDLWLKESFAEFMGADASLHATRFTDAWADFAGTRKNWAYVQDQLPTTHPIKAEIPDVDAARQNFDGITYTKGAATLKQLVHFVGRDNFYAAAREYFRQHAFGTATFDDLIAALANHTDQDLHDWSKRWLRTSGPDQLIPEVTTAGNTIKQLSIVQNGSPQTRPHRLTVSLFHGAPLECYHSMDVRLPGIPGKNTELTEAHGLPAPDLILLNDNDHTYAKIGFDPTSLHTIKARLGNITDNVSRAVIWTALWNLTRDAELLAQDYIDIVMLHGANEPNPSIIEQVFANAYVAATKFTTDPTVIADLVYSLWDLMYQAKPGSDTQLVLVRAAITALAADRKPGSARKLRELLGGHLAGLVLSPDIRWRIIAALASHDDMTAQELLAEREADNTLDGQAAYLQAMYSYPHAKQQAFDDLLHAMDYSNEEVNALIAGFRAPTDPHQGSHHNTHPATPDFAAEFFANLNHIWTEYPIEIANRIVRGLYPETAAAVAKTEEILETELPGALHRVLLECKDQVQRELAAQEFNNSAS